MLKLLNTKQFIKLERDPTKTNEGKLQSMLRKMKGKLTKNEYTRLYPTGSSPGKFYGTAKLHKISNSDPVDEFPLRLIISNSNFADRGFVN